MLKHSAYYPDAVAPPPSDRTHPDLRLASDHDAPVASPARALQLRAGQGLIPDSSWSVRRTVIIGVIFHLGVFSALGLAAGAALTQFGHP
ncbi:hypothetical protein [Caulobacter sp.]|uniref:hypothetical protein n=1 Tax=Caulobacter sp. TaxID=78 RepID=UPI002B4A69A0|nr:hypothetical protein [Caulobacter sp.]HJV40999.1 hypothetical protein [Caulobacter sp.]